MHVNAYNLNLIVQDAVLNVPQYCDATSILRILIISLRICLSACSYSRAYSILLTLSTIVLQNLVNTVLLFNQLRITTNSLNKFFMQLMQVPRLLTMQCSQVHIKLDFILFLLTRYLHSYKSNKMINTFIGLLQDATNQFAEVLCKPR